MGALTREGIRSPESGRKLLNLLYDRYPRVSPEFLGAYEPLRARFDRASLENISDWWQPYVVLWKRRKPSAAAILSFGAKAKHDLLLLTLDSRTLADEELRSLVEDIVALTRADLAYVYPVVDQEAEMLDRREQLMAFILGMNNRDIRKGIPDLGWLTLFGEPYIQLFSAHRLLSSPVARAVQLSSGHIEVQVCASPHDFARQFAACDEIRMSAKRHLGLEAFWSSAAADKPVHAPNWDQLLANISLARGPTA